MHYYRPLFSMTSCFVAFLRPGENLTLCKESKLILEHQTAAGSYLFWCSVSKEKLKIFAHLMVLVLWKHESKQK